MLAGETLIGRSVLFVGAGALRLKHLLAFKGYSSSDDVQDKPNLWRIAISVHKTAH